MRKPKAVLFDWDGTLYDSARLCFDIYEELFRRFGVGAVTYQEFRRDFTGDYHRYLTAKGIGKDKWGDFDRSWYEIYYSKKDKAKPFPESKKALEKLRRLGIPLGLVTNAERERMDGELGRLGLGKFFGSVVTIEDAEWEFKPSPRMVLLACEELGVKPADALYVGDMAEDVIAGRGAGAITGAVPTGIHLAERLIREKPDFLFSSVEDVPEVFG